MDNHGISKQINGKAVYTIAKFPRCDRSEFSIILESDNLAYLRKERKCLRNLRKEKKETVNTSYVITLGPITVPLEHL